MVFDFDRPVERAHTDSEKWSKYAGQDIIPLWVADTDFKSPPCVIEALEKRVQQGVFGYGYPSPELIDIFIKRMKEYYQWNVQPEWLVFLPGLVCGLNLAVRAVTEPYQATINPNPIYPPFKKSSVFAQRNQIAGRMKIHSNRWVLDIEDIKHQLHGNEKLFMLCNPHNPGGTVYRREELHAILELAQQHNLYVCSDEIHCDLLIDQNLTHLPFALLSEDAAQRSITLMAPSKTYNIAGLGASIAIIPNETLRQQFIKTRAGIVPSVDILAYVAATAAYQGGEDWLQEQLTYLRANHDLVYQRINAMNGLKMLPCEATYLAWIDASGLQEEDPQLFFEKAGVGLSSGVDFGDSQFVRLNFGCHRDLLIEALNRMQSAIEQRK